MVSWLLSRICGMNSAKKDAHAIPEFSIGCLEDGRIIRTISVELVFLYIRAMRHHNSIVLTPLRNVYRQVLETLLHGWHLIELMGILYRKIYLIVCGTEWEKELRNTVTYGRLISINGIRNNLIYWEKDNKNWLCAIYLFFIPQLEWGFLGHKTGMVWGFPHIFFTWRK